MIPILFSKTETQFLSNGVGRLADCISCEVTEERNGLYECEFTYPITGKWYKYIIENGGIIYATHDDTKQPQPFDIYKWSAPINGIVTFNARHISYRLLGITVEPFTAASCFAALQGIGTNSMQTNPFTFWTDKIVASSFALPAPASARSILAGNAGSILDVYGKGEYEFDKFTVKLHTNRGSNSGVSIRYGKNLSDMTAVMDAGQVFNAVSPFWKGDDGTLVMLPEKYIVATGTAGDVCVPLDLSTDFEEEPTQADLRTRAERYLTENEPWVPDNNITVDFVQLWQTDEYKDYAPLERASLCDTVYISYPALGVSNATAKIIKTVYNTLQDKYSQMELGKPQTTLQEAILSPMEKDISDVEAIAMQKVSDAELADALSTLTGADGGHIVIGRDAYGKPQAIYIMDTEDTQTAVNVWRFNLNGLGHSHTGFNGPYDDVALSADGKINASMILAGYLTANIIKGGTLTLGGLNDENGVIYVNDSNGTTMARIDNQGIEVFQQDPNTGLNSVVLAGGYFLMQTGGTTSVYINRYNSGDGYIQVCDDQGNPRALVSGGEGVLRSIDINGYARAQIASDGTVQTRDQYNVLRYDIGTNGSLSAYNGSGIKRVEIDSTNGAIILYDLFGNERFRVDENNVVIGGVLDLTARHCAATLSSSGWYRAIQYHNDESALAPYGTHGAIVHITIIKDNGTVYPEIHTIDLDFVFGSSGLSFSMEKSVTGSTQCIDKIRYVVPAGDRTGFVDIHYARNDSNKVTVVFSVEAAQDEQANFTASDLTERTDTTIPSVAEHNFIANGFNFTSSVYMNGTLLHS